MNHGTATKASILQLKKRNEERRKEYNDEIVTIKSYVQKEMQRLVDKYDRSQDAVQFDLHSSTLFKPQHKFSLEDAKVAEMVLLHNTDQPVGQKLWLKELKALARDHIDYQSMTKEEEKVLVQWLEDQWQIKLRSVRINNIAAGADFRKTGTHIGQEINNLGVQTGALGICVLMRSHLDDSFQAQVHANLGVEGFFWDIYHIEILDLARQFELWACTQSKNLDERETTSTICKEITAKLTDNLRL
ncbi:uncharacterized protein ARMOST_00561 [Armillaria ostoyae]|uniref:Uncharacterized protein n=1 Tax=Armillaria ostoyae TaxID=47428 RepID=A0A284QLF7_ARMOS|nr:uncharacterized protein ARMOST_00561 [Armillaria ostoyae]